MLKKYWYFDAGKFLILLTHENNDNFTTWKVSTIHLIFEKYWFMLLVNMKCVDTWKVWWTLEKGWYFLCINTQKVLEVEKYISILEKYCYLKCIDTWEVSVLQKYWYLKSMDTWKVGILENYFYQKVRILESIDMFDT